MKYHLAVVLGLMLPISLTHASAQDDTYISGYAAGLLKQNLKLELPPLMVKDGVITLPVSNLEAGDRSKALQLLAEIPGVKGVKASEAATSPLTGGSTAVASEAVTLPTGLLPTGHLFKPFIADTRWAHLSVAYRNYQTNNFDGKNIVSVSLGETIPFYRSNFGQSTAQWETGLQAGVFSDFDLDSKSKDLINTDYIASFYSSMRAGQFSAFGRLYHQSSHLGDEYLLGQLALNNTFQRVNLSYEGLDLKFSYEIPYGVRIYGGGGGIFDKEPSTLRTWSAQYGVEFRSPWRIEALSMRPIAAADLKNYDQNNWSTNISARAGVEFEKFQVLGRKLQILGEYYNGYTPSGQFYKTKVEYIGLGMHYHF